MTAKNGNAQAGDLGAAKTTSRYEPKLNSPHNSKTQVYSLRFGGSRVFVRVVPCGQLYRIEWPDIGPSPPANLTRCRSAAREWAELKAMTESRKMSVARRLKSLNNFSWSSLPVEQKGALLCG
jgi:hypothetical protein